MTPAIAKPAARTKILRVRLTPEEYAELELRGRRQGQFIGEYVRSELGCFETRQPAPEPPRED